MFFRNETFGMAAHRNLERKQTHKIGILIEQDVRRVTLKDNQIEAATRVEDRRENRTTPAQPE